MRREGYTYTSGACPAVNQERFFLYSFVELGGYENHSVVLDTLDIQPFLWLEAAFNGDHCSLSEAVE